MNSTPQPSDSSLRYDVVLPTRNRPGFLPLAVSSLLDQSIPPQRLIIIDASDDPTATPAALSNVVGRATDAVDLQIHHAEPGTSAQRNLGLRHVSSKVVFFADDDALWFPDAAEHVLALYERDSDQRIGGITMMEVRQPPANVAGVDVIESHGSGLAKALYKLSRTRSKLEDRFFPNPMHLAGEALQAQHYLPSFVDGIEADVIRAMGGWKASYRTDAIKAHGFDETLSGYGLYEDIDASYAVAAKQLLVRTTKAAAYHHRAPGPRAAGTEIGAKLILNLCYVTLKHTPPDSPARRAILPYVRTRMLLYSTRAGSAYGRERRRGIQLARTHLDGMLEASPEQLPQAYEAALTACVDGAASTR